MPVAEAGKRVKHAVQAGLKAAKLRHGATAHEVVLTSGPSRLLRYRPEQPVGRPLLLVTPFINRFRVVDLQEETSLVGSLVSRGVEVYVIDWGEPRRIDGSDRFEDYVRFVGRAADVVDPTHPVDLAGYCLGGTVSILFAATHPDRVGRLVTICSPVDFSVDHPSLEQMRQWVEPAHFPVEKLTAAFGTYPGALIQQGFLWQRPVGSALKMVRAWPKFSERDFAEFFAVLESWNQDGVDIPGATYRRLIHDLYRENRLVTGEFLLHGRPVDLKRIRCPLLIVTAASDHICPPAAAAALKDLAGSQQAEVLALRGGHITAIVGPRAIESLHHPLADWLLAEPKAQLTARAEGESA